MNRRLQRKRTGNDGVSFVFALPFLPSSADAFNAAMVAVLEAGFGFGREWAGQVASSYDPQGEHYAPAICVPAYSFTTALAAARCVAQVAHHYNRSVALSFGGEACAVPVTGRVYDEPTMLVVSLDWAPAAWQQLVACGGARTVSLALLDAARMVFGLVSAWWVIIGPSPLLEDVSTLPDAACNLYLPVVLCRAHDPSLQRAPLGTAHVEAVPGGVAVVRCWNVGKRALVDRPGKLRGRRRVPAWRAKGWKKPPLPDLRPMLPQSEEGAHVQTNR